MSMGERLKMARKKRGLSQDELAKSIGVSRGVVTNIEYDKIGKPQPIIVDAIVKALHIRKDWFLTGEGSMEGRHDHSHSSDTLAELYEVAKTLSEDEQLYLLDTVKAMKARFGK